MKGLRWFVCFSYLVVCGVTEGRGSLVPSNVLTKIRQTPAVERLASAFDKVSNKWGQKTLVIATSLALTCGAMSCDSDDRKWAYGLEGQYIVFTSGADGSVSAGYVFRAYSYSDKVRVGLFDNDSRVDIHYAAILGQLERGHKWVGKEVWFKAGAHTSIDVKILSGTLSTIYTEFESGEVVAVAVSVHSGTNFYGEEVYFSPAFSVFLPES